MNPTPELPSQPPVRPRMGLAIASLVLGILAFLLSVVLVGALLGIIGIVLGILHVQAKRGPRAMALWGVGLSFVGIVAALGFGALYYQGFKTFKAAMTAAMQDNTDFQQWQGVVAPDITLTTLDGETIQLKDLRGKRVVLDFWATWCPPCVKEIPHFVQLRKEIAKDDLVIIGISQEEKDTLASFIKKNGINYPIVSTNGLPAPFSGIQSIPTTFFIDRKGVIQEVEVGYHDLATLKELALAADYQGEPKLQPAPAASGLTNRATMLTPSELWSKPIAANTALCAGDWDGDGTAEIFIQDGSRKLHVLGADGTEKASVMLPDKFGTIEAGRHGKDFRLLGYSNWGHKIIVMDKTGKEIWSVSALWGVDGAHWGDLDGDGTDELIAGMNGAGGLSAYSAEGKELWNAKLGNVWNQAVVPAAKERPALVFATEAGGSVKVFDATGKLLRSLKPRGEYFTQMTAAALDDQGTVQVLAIGSTDTVAFDENGVEAWATPAPKNAMSWRGANFSYGDVDAEGENEWVLREASGELVVATGDGEKVASLAGHMVDGFAVLPAADGHGLLVTSEHGTVHAYGFK